MNFITWSRYLECVVSLHVSLWWIQLDKEIHLSAMYSESEFMESWATISIFRESNKTKVTEKFPNKKVLLSITPSADLPCGVGGKPTLARGYLSWLGIPTLARGYLPWLGIPTLAGGYLPWCWGTHLGVPPSWPGHRVPHPWMEGGSTPK